MFVSPKVHVMLVDPVWVDLSEAEKHTKMTGSHYNKVKHSAGRVRDPAECPDGKALKMCEEPTDPIGAGRKIVNAESVERPGTFVPVADIYASCAVNRSVPAELIKNAPETEC